MCGRFWVEGESDNELLARMMEEAARRQKAVTGESTISAGEVFPASAVAAMAQGRSGGPGMYPMLWGFHRPDGKGLVINARSETALEKPMFRGPLLERRCLVPCSWYFEWETRQNSGDGAPSLQIGAPAAGARRGGAVKIKYAIRPKASGIVYLAAVYRYEESSRLPVLSILTREAAPGIAFIHPRMPVIFSEKTHGLWLEKSADIVSLLSLCETDMTYRAA